MKPGGDPHAVSVSGFGSTSFGLISDVKKADDAAWQRLVNLYSPLIAYWCRQAGVTSHDTADLTQDVFRSLATSIETFHRDQEGDSFRGWLRTVTRNKIADYLRLEARTLSAVGGTDHQLVLGQLPNDGEGSNKICPSWEVPPFRAAVELVRCEFEQRTWRAFWRTAVDGQSASQVAEELGMSHAAVRKAKSRILNRMRAELSNPVDEHSPKSGD